MISQGIAAATMTAAGWIAAQALLLGFFPERLRFRGRLLLYAFSLGFFLVWQWESVPLNLLNGLLLHLLLFCTFMEWYYCVDRPVTLRILVEAWKRKGEPLERANLYRSYGLDYMIGRRLEALASSGYLEARGERYYLTRKGKLFAAVFERGSRLFGVRQR